MAARHTGTETTKRAPLVPRKGAVRRAALKFLGLVPDAPDETAYRVISRWLEREKPRFYEYYDRFVEPYEPITRSIVHVRDPERAARLRAWQQHPLHDSVPYEAIFEGGDPEDVEDDDVVVTYRLAAERIAARFGLSPANTTKLTEILTRQWNPAWSAEDPITITAALTGCAPNKIAAQRQLRNLLRRSPDCELGRPRGTPADGIDDAADELRLHAKAIHPEVVRICQARHADTRDAAVVALLARSGVPDSKVLRNAVDHLLARVGGAEPRRVLVFVLTRIYRQQFPGLRELQVSRLLSAK